ncbi:MAG: lipopolysaccharide heptosyltransferase II, partial [Rhodoferax sp.]|nr:lipopolysaccharide heptosyltransferase II [Rhodoferax sp.]
MTRSLLVAPQWIGDSVMTEPLLRRLHARGEWLTVAALPWVAPVYRAMPQVAEVMELPYAHGSLHLPARRKLAVQLRGRFDVAYVCPNSLKSALIPWWAGIARRVGYAGESRYLLLNQRLPNPAPGQRPPMVAFYSALSLESGTEWDRPQLQLSPAVQSAALQAVSALLAAAGKSGLPLTPQGYDVFAPGAEYGQAKRWPAAHFAELAARLNLPVLLLGSAKEQGLCADIAAAAHIRRPGACINLAGRTGLEQALALIAAAKTVVSNDSGLMHVAAAFGLPQVAIFGSSSPLHTPPLNPKAQVLWLKNNPDYQPPLDCAPCYARECPLVHT